MYDFLGTFTDTQRDEFFSWVKSNYTALNRHREFYKVRAAQLRRTAGILEAFYNKRGLKSTFNKDIYTPPPGGPSIMSSKDDGIPAEMISDIKSKLKDSIEYQDEAVFRMNFTRYLIEKNEDLAQIASDAPNDLETLINSVLNLFDLPQYRDILIKSDDTYEGAPRFRTDSLAPRTPYEESLSPSLTKKV